MICNHQNKIGECTLGPTNNDGTAVVITMVEVMEAFVVIIMGSATGNNDSGGRGILALWSWVTVLIFSSDDDNDEGNCGH